MTVQNTIITSSMELSSLVVWTLDSFPAVYVTRRFNTEFTRALHLPLPWARPVQCTSPHPTSTRSILILSNHLRHSLPSGLLPSGFLTNNLYAFLFSPHSCYIPRPSHPPRFSTIIVIILGEECKLKVPHYVVFSSWGFLYPSMQRHYRRLILLLYYYAATCFGRSYSSIIVKLTYDSDVA
jgi:hypothetical protein